MNRVDTPVTADHGQGDFRLATLLGCLGLIGLAVYAVAGLPRLPAGLPTLPTDPDIQLELLIRTPTSAQLDAATFVLTWAFWLGWLFVVASIVLRILAIVAERVTDDAPWARSLRSLSDVLTLPFVRRIIDASLAGTLLVRTTLGTPGFVLASAAPAMVQAENPPDTGQQGLASQKPLPSAAEYDLRPEPDVVHAVRSGESLASIAERYRRRGAMAAAVADNRDGRSRGRNTSRGAKSTPLASAVRGASERGVRC